MDEESIVYTFFLIFAGSAILATVALYARQALLVAYILLGALLGPSGFALVKDPQLIQSIANIGIIFLLFLLGLNLYPQKLLRLFRQALPITLISALVFGLLGFGLTFSFGFGVVDALLVGVSCIFSSTILGLKLLPTTILHHRHAGEIIISILLLQDLLAILVLSLLHAVEQGQLQLSGILKLSIAFPLLLAIAYFGEKLLLQKLLRSFDRIHEYIFLLAIGWCLGIAELASVAGLSYEVGAFIAGVSLANSPIARFIAENLKPLRDFFLVMFFFALGAGFDFAAARTMLVPTFILATMLLVIKPVVFHTLLRRTHEAEQFSWEIGFRLGQLSEFSLLLVFVAQHSGVLSNSAAYLIQSVTLLSFVVSSYLVVLRYPTPMAVTEALRRE
ncbi:MAG TPA: cation:proton antiporter [Gammaproteobacteria bacterium]|nr:cation:proton antiporter [Gammaproteobacteria bacterium]